MKVLVYCPNHLLSLKERNGYLAVKRFWDRDPTNHIKRNKKDDKKVREPVSSSPPVAALGPVLFTQK